MDAKRGTKIDGRFTLERRLGVGGFGSVWLAADEQAKGISRQVALKLLHPKLRDGRGLIVDRFRREAALLSRLDHPNVTRPLAFNADCEHPYLAMEYVDGLPLDRVIKECALLDAHVETEDLVRIFDELCAAIAYAHAREIVHRDLKPSNVMLVRRAGRVFVKVLDFGIGKLLAEGTGEGTTVGRVLGSMFYLSPEQAAGEPAGVPADIYALGVTLFEMLTLRRAWVWSDDGRPAPAGKPPIGAANNTADRVIERIKTAPRPRVSDLREGVPLAVDEIVARAMAIDPRDRFENVEAFSRAALPVLREIASAKSSMTIIALREALEPSDDEARLVAEVEAIADLTALPPVPTLPPVQPFFTPARTAVITTACLMFVAAGFLVGVRSMREPEPQPQREPQLEPVAAPSPGIVPRPSVVAEPAIEVPEQPPAPAPLTVKRKELAARPAAPAPIKDPRIVELERLVASARENPKDLARVAQLSDRIIATATELLAGAERTRIARLAQTGAIDGDVDALAECVKILESAAKR